MLPLTSIKEVIVAPLAALSVCLGIGAEIPLHDYHSSSPSGSPIVTSPYGLDFRGHPTESGELYDARLLTAAHRQLPFGTRILVTNPSNNKSVVVRVNDRGPFALDQDLNISGAAAEQIGLAEGELATATVTVLP